MLVSKKWLLELVKLNISMDELVELLPMRTISTKEVTDQFIELDMKGYNRADLLSMRGVALEIAAITDSKTTFPEIPDIIWQSQKDEDDIPKKLRTDLPELKIKIENSDLVPVYVLAKVEGLKVEPSPKEWVEKLESCGMRSVNNIADITNLIMLEYGQPLHAFDANTVKDEAIIVRNAKDGETLVTLDNKKRELTENDILITDSEKILGLGGVMGGKDSEVSDETTTILLEAAIFDPVTLRKTANRLKLTSEASKRFIHGLTKQRLIEALNAAISLYQEIGGKLTALSVPENLTDEEIKIDLRLSKVNSLIGIDLTAEEVEVYLEKLNFVIARDGIATVSTNPRDDIIWQVTRPVWRLDIEIETDLIEEIARLYGYEKIPAKELPGEKPEAVNQAQYQLVQKIKKALVDLGFTEIQSYSYFSTETLENLGWKDKAPNGEENTQYFVKVSNPISSETEYLRMNLWPNLTEVIAKNIKQGFEDIAIFELGKVFIKKDGERPVEKYYLTLALMNGTDNPISELHTLVQRLNKEADLELELKESEADNLGLFHPVRILKVLKDGSQIGGLAEVHKRITDKYAIMKRVAVFEIDLQSLLDAKSRS